MDNCGKKTLERYSEKLKEVNNEISELIDWIENEGKCEDFYCRYFFHKRIGKMYKKRNKLSKIIENF